MPAGLGEELGAEADQPAGGDQVLHPHPAGAVVDHLLHPPLAQREQLGDDADVLLGGVDAHPLDRLVALAVDLPGHDLRLADGQLEALAAHQLDQDRQRELAAALDLPHVGTLGLGDPQRDVADQLALQPRLDLGGGQVLAVLAGQRRAVDPDRHRQRRLVDGDDRQRLRVLGVGERVADGDLADPRHRDDVAGRGLGGVDAIQRLGHVQLGDPHPLDRPVRAAPGDGLAAPDRPVAHAADRDPPDVRGGVEVGDVGLQRVLGVVLGCGHVLDQQVEQRLEVGARVVDVERRLARLGVGVDDREVDLRLVGVEVEEQLVDLIDDLRDARVGPVDLVDDQDHRQPQLERLAQHEAGLGQRPLGGVDEQQHPVDHRQAALDLAAEVGVARGVDDVELDVAVADGRVLGQDRDPLLALEVHRVQHALVDVLVLAEGAGLPQQRVDERRLAVVDVGDDREVADV